MSATSAVHRKARTVRQNRVARSPLCRQVGRVHLPVARTARPPAVGPDLDDHPATALRTEPGGSRPIRAAVGVAVSASSRCTLYTPAATGARCFPATISTIYRLALSAFSGICSSSSSSRSASAGRPRVVR